MWIHLTSKRLSKTLTLVSIYFIWHFLGTGLFIDMFAQLRQIIFRQNAGVSFQLKLP